MPMRITARSMWACRTRWPRDLADRAVHRRHDRPEPGLSSAVRRCAGDGAIGFLISGLATTNLFFGYLNWVVGYADADHRPLYVGLSNTVAALVSLIAPFIAGTIVQKLGYRPLFAVALIMALSALFVAVQFLRDPESQRSAP